MDGMIETGTDQRVAPSNPFDEEAVAYQVTKPVNVAQLADEIKKALSVPRVIISSQATMDDNVRVLFIAPVLNEETVAALVEAHVSNPAWGQAASIEGLSEALVKLRSGATLTTKEISLVLRGLL